ncbi:hypothetical protein [Mycobacterium paragordonae]|uniref:Uncharacterized protein n=1 Tax=Mycobacterium paragordonae TaxID=1389713 RepID=A0AAJ1RZE2_9MYCO|nr:hypothetical protein [Mycobacterium paragordonae]MDP7733657.1 hypothetical protein [Mycobacterium paragordonae]
MTTRDDDMLAGAVDRTAETIREYVRQIESGEYGDEWTITDEFGNQATVTASSESDALDMVYDTPEYLSLIHGDADSWDVERVEADEPTVNETPIYEYPLEIVDRRGSAFAVVLGIGGPHIEVTANGWESARLEGYWGGSRVTRYGDYLSTFLDYFIDRDDSEV